MDDFKEYGLTSRMFYRIKLLLDKTSALMGSYVKYRNFRLSAICLREKIILSNGKEVVTRKMKKKIKDYCKTTLGSKAYWPWLAVYTELRGEFKEGWIPSDYYRFELLPKLNPKGYRNFSEVKSIDRKFFDELIVAPLFIRSNGYYYDNSHKIKTKSEIKEILYKLDDEIIIKPDFSRGGKGIIFSNSRELNLDELPDNRNLVFQKVVKQHDIINGLYPHSINTFRVITIIDKTGQVRVLFLILRFGRGGNRIDNSGSGGGWVFVNKNGTVEPNAYDADGIPLGTKHPDTGTIYSDLKIPFVDKICKFSKNAHSRFPYTRFIGWDVFVNREGNPKLLEWNADIPGFYPIEAQHGPFLGGFIDEVIENCKKNHWVLK